MLAVLVITVQASLLFLRLFKRGDPFVTSYYLVRDPSELGDMSALSMNFDVAVQILDQNDLGFALDSTYLNLVAQIETIPKAGVLEVTPLTNGLVPCTT